MVVSVACVCGEWECVPGVVSVVATAGACVRLGRHQNSLMCMIARDLAPPYIGDPDSSVTIRGFTLWLSPPVSVDVGQVLPR